MNSKSFFKNHNLLSIETYQNDDLKILNNINSIDDIKRNFNKPILKKNKINLFNQNNICISKNIKNKYNHILDSINNDCHVNYFYKTENNSQIFNQEKNEKMNQKRFDSSENIIRENKSNHKFIPEINYFNTLNLNNLNFNDNKTIKENLYLKSDYIKIIEKLSNVIEQLEEYQNEMTLLKQENIHLKKILLNSNYSNKSNTNNTIKIEKLEYLNIIDTLKKELKNLKNEYDNYIFLNEKKNLINIQNKNNEIFNEQIIKLQFENTNIKKENNFLKHHSENSDMDYVKLLKRNEKLNQEIFKLRNIIDNYMNSKTNLSITNFSFAIKINKSQNIQTLFKRTSNISNKITTDIISKNNKKKKMNKNYSKHDNIVSTIEKENKSLINKVEKIEDRLNIYLKNKFGNNINHHHYNSYSHK